MSTVTAKGPLAGLRLIEIAGVGPGPFAAMLLSDMGAEIVRIDRIGRAGDAESIRTNVLLRGRRSVAVDLKTDAGIELVLRLVEHADGLMEGFRPGVMERLGLGPSTCLVRNPRLVYGRMTGWGQDGPYANSAGHDINYVALAGALFHFGRERQPPTPPLNVVGDFGGGGMLLAFGMLCALLHAGRTGEGQVVDASMVDGTAILMTMTHAFLAAGTFDEDKRGTNVLDSGAPYYDSYETADGEWVSIACIEPQFYEEFLRRVGLDVNELPDRDDRANWPALRRRFDAVFKSRTRDEWCEILDGTDACFAPVLRVSEAARHPHNVSRGTFVELDSIVQAAPAPRFSMTPGAIQGQPAAPGEHTDEVLAEWLGELPSAVRALRECGAVA